MSWLGGIIGVEKSVDVAERTLSGVGSWIDEQQFTAEEKSNANKQLLDASLDFYKLAYDQNSIRSVTRRWLAWGIVFCVLVFAVAAGIAASIDNAALAASLIDISKAFWLGEAFIAVIAFYFGGHLIKR